MKIFIDLDDTLNKLTMVTLRGLGCQGDYPVSVGYNIVTAANIMPSERWVENAYLNIKTIWDHVDWENLPRSDEFDLIINLALSKGRVCILTRIHQGGEDIARAKIKWIQRELPEIDYLIGTNKSFCAGPEALLIDDCDDNINNFRKSGGAGILVPRPWNSLHDTNTMDYLKEQFNAL